MAHRLEKKPETMISDEPQVLEISRKSAICIYIYTQYIDNIHRYGYNEVIKNIYYSKYTMNGLMWTFRLSYLSFRHISQKPEERIPVGKNGIY